MERVLGPSRPLSGCSPNPGTVNWQEGSIKMIAHIPFYILGEQEGPPAKGKRAKKDTSSLKPVDHKKVSKRKAASKPASKKEVPKKDPNKAKRSLSAFFVFMEDFRKTFKKENPNVKVVSAVGKVGGDKWKSMSQACPLLCKEFIVDSWQIYHANNKGADAILLIAAVLPNLDIQYMT